MANVIKGRVRLFIYSATLLCHSEMFATSNDAEACSKEALLKEECNYENAVQKRDCLREQIAKFKECERKVAALDDQLVEKINEKAEAQRTAKK